jgi:hypothetical protein
MIVIARLFLSGPGQVYEVVDWLHANRGIGLRLVTIILRLLFVLIGTPFAFGYCLSLLITAAGFRVSLGLVCA